MLMSMKTSLRIHNSSLYLGTELQRGMHASIPGGVAGIGSRISTSATPTVSGCGALENSSMPGLSVLVYSMHDGCSNQQQQWGCVIYPSNPCYWLVVSHVSLVNELHTPFRSGWAKCGPRMTTRGEICAIHSKPLSIDQASLNIMKS